MKGLPPRWRHDPDLGVLVHESGTFQIEFAELGTHDQIVETARFAEDLAELFAWLTQRPATDSPGKTGGL